MMKMSSTNPDFGGARKQKVLKSKTNAASSLQLVRRSIRNTIKSRQDAYRRKVRENVDLKLKAIEIKMVEGSLHDPVHHDRPYGLPKGMEGHRRHVWDLIFAHVHELNTIVNLREVCAMFKELIERKYLAARLPEVINCLERKDIPWESNNDEDKGNTWLDAMTFLRSISKSTKNAVDLQFNRGLLGRDDSKEWFSVDWPHYITEEWRIPALRLGIPDIIQEMRPEELLEILNSQKSPKATFLIKALTFAEYRAVDIHAHRDAFHKCLEIIGSKVTSFQYFGVGPRLENYNFLRRCIVLMPNLQEIMIHVIGRLCETTYENVGSFPKCHKLERFAEGPEGFGYPFISEIFNANPSIEEVLLNYTDYRLELDVDKLNDAMLRVSRLTKFHLVGMPTLQFLECRFDWTLNLRTLALWQKYATFYDPREIPSKVLFDFISRCKNLKTLLVSLFHVRDTGGYINLPELEYVHWKVLSDFTSLEFLKPIENLKSLALDLSCCCVILKRKEDVMQYLGEWHLPELFPALEMIRVKTEINVCVFRVRRILE